MPGSVSPTTLNTEATMEESEHDMHLRGLAAWHKRRHFSAGDKHNQFVLVDRRARCRDAFSHCGVTEFRRFVGVECVTRPKPAERTLHRMYGA